MTALTAKFIIDKRTKKKKAVYLKLSIHQAILIYDLLKLYGGAPLTTARGYSNEIQNIFQNGLGFAFNVRRTNNLLNLDNYFTNGSKLMIDSFAQEIINTPNTPLNPGVWRHTIEVVQ